MDLLSKPILEFIGEYRFLSNFWPAPWVKVDGVAYHSVEHAYQASKTVILKDRDQFRDGTITAGMAKHIGQELVLRPNWDIIKTTIMTGLVMQKFLDPDLKELLLATAPAKLVEGNRWHDQVWGDCYCPKHKQVPGLNNLGKILMKVREEYKSLA